MHKIVRRAPILSRRGVLSGIAFGLALGGGSGRSGATEPNPAAPGAGAAADMHGMSGTWVRLGTDGTIEIAFPAVEMGQGSMTGLSMVIAEELDADWSRVGVFIPPNVAATYGNPHWGGSQSTFGSYTIMGYWDKARLHGAAMRRVLLQAAADRWGVPLAELHTEPSVVVHAATGRRIGYGDIAGFATVPAQMPVVTTAELKRFSNYRILGTAPARFDVPAKSDGSAVFGIDVRLPGMVYATLLGPPVEGSVPLGFDDTDAKAVPGVTNLIQLPAGIVIVGTTVEAVFAARELVAVTWSKLERDGYDSVATLRDYRTRAADLSDKGVVWRNVGDTGQAFATAATVIHAAYTTDHVYHAQMEPLGATALVNEAGDGAEIWVSTQAQTATAAAIAGLLNTSPGKITINHQYAGGGFGRRSAVDFVTTAVLVSKQLKRPVKMIYTREQDVRSAKMRPMTGQYLEAALDRAGTLVGWRHRIVAESILGYRWEQALEAAKGVDPLVMVESQPPYAIANQLVTYHREKHGSPLAPYRGIGAGHNVFALEAFFDEVAAAQTIDPVEYRLRLMAHEPRALAVIRATAEMAAWGKVSAPGRAKGFAFGQLVETWIAGVVEISLDRHTGAIRAHHFWTTLDPGVAVNLDSIRAQTEGNVIFGLSGALKERMTLVNGTIEQSNYYDYDVLRMSETPEIHINITPTDNPATGIGEAAIPLVAPCLSNAMFALTGKRLRDLPFSRDRVKASLTAV